MPARRTAKVPIEIVCSRCLGDRILRDAWAAWDEETQSWELHIAFDHAFCEDYDGETSLLEVPLTAEDSRVDAGGGGICGSGFGAAALGGGDGLAAARQRGGDAACVRCSATCRAGRIGSGRLAT